MKCPGCEYELWNLKAGPCPECGRPFKPSEFDFLANAVRFCCPHCDQAYYGTSETGQLQPDRFDCVACGTHVTVDEMILRPAEALGKREPTRTINPWLDPHRRGRWFPTIGAGIGQPGRLLESTPAIGTSGRAAVYAGLNFVIAGLLGIVLGLLMSFAGGGGGVGVLVTVTAVFIIAPAIYCGVWALTTHGLLKLFRQPTPDGIGRTFQAIAFTSGPWVIAIIPCVGWMLGFVGWSACAPAAVRAAHKCRVGPAVVATLVLPVVTVVGVVGLYASLVFGPIYSASASSYGQPAWASGSQLDWDVVLLADELRAAVNAGTPPRHGASLLGQNSPVPYTAFSDASAYDVPIGSHTASSIDAMSEPARAAALSSVTASWPANITSHRIGRIIFTHYGVRPVDDPRLWLLVELPTAPGDTLADPVTLGGTGGLFNVSTNPQDAVDQQNRLRAKAGLPPLPSYQTMTTSTGPWTAPDGQAPGTP